MEDVRCEAVGVDEPAIGEVECLNIEISRLLDPKHSLHQFHVKEVKASTIAVLEDHDLGGLRTGALLLGAFYI